MYAFTYHRASGLRQATNMLEKFEEPKLLAGGQTLLPTMKLRLASPKNIVDLGAIEGLAEIELRGRSLVSRFLEQREVVVVPFGASHWSIAAEAFIRYGKGRHPAALNYGDCMTYATAKVAGAPLLFVGDDFAQTDIAAAG